MFGVHLCAAQRKSAQARVVDDLPCFEVVSVVGLAGRRKSSGIAEGAASGPVLGWLRRVAFGQLVGHFGGERVGDARLALEGGADQDVSIG